MRDHTEDKNQFNISFHKNCLEKKTNHSSTPDTQLHFNDDRVSEKHLVSTLAFCATITRLRFLRLLRLRVRMVDFSICNCFFLQQYLILLVSYPLYVVYFWWYYTLCCIFLMVPYSLLYISDGKLPSIDCLLLISLMVPYLL